ncbi:AraC family transcriptional regulator [Vibrio ziniensis]|uniref:AraC effector-binding domain-containing protein n=1 Tax=Vibrio ziniensis TaxID=2711221 RepID=A0A6G7CJF8_9VIBR|nr:GyrI-like domain-containing protein [Vibrio ziniensis]QIH42245.1 hypothetical protein G5S32_09655 [Vibrio ziniensis]
MNVRIVEFTPRKVAIFSHQGAPEQLMNSVENFVSWRKETGLSPISTSDTFGIPYSDPNETDKTKFRFDIAGSVEEDIPQNQFGVVNGVLTGGKCAVLRHYGNLDLISQTVHALYRNWLPTSGERTSGEPCFFHYLNIGPNTEKSALQTDVYLPLK